jgi:hypothetical protein
VGDSGANLNPLCEITDPDEIAGILARSSDEAISMTRRFESLFGRARKNFGDDAAEPFDKSNEVAAAEGQALSAGNPTIDEAQKELVGLRDKVREVARQIGRA